MITDRGWSVLGAACALIVLWIVFGEIELAAVAGLLAACVGVGLARRARPTVGLTRHLEPARVHEGDKVTVLLELSNAGRSHIFNLEVDEPVGDLGRARFGVGSLGPGDQATAGYQVVCRPRGVYPIGPASVSVSDAMGLTLSSASVGETDRLVVYPQVELLLTTPLVRGHDPTTHASRPEFSHRGGEEFYTLREYQTGDELRRVHWPSSAKRDELMIRQLETPWQSKGLVIVDTRTSSYLGGPDFEKAVTGAASLVHLLAGAGFDADLWIGGGSSLPLHDYHTAMEALALVKADDGLDLLAAAAHLRHRDIGGGLFVVTGMGDPSIVQLVQYLSSGRPKVVVMTVGEAISATSGVLLRMGVSVVSVTVGGSWTEAWRRSTERGWSTVSA